ncbi:MAG: DUF4398 domain-containing protein [Treponema sp.]|nr:DUF4398 domain-containing protein [Treponema sp.]
MKFKLIYILFIVLITLLGCDNPPLEEMENAREAVFRAASDPNVTAYAADTLARARDSLRRMETEADSKSYDAARNHAAEAISAANRAIEEGRLRADTAVREVIVNDSGLSRQASIDANAVVQEEIEETLRNINGARYALLDLDYDSLDLRIARVFNILDQAEADILAGRYQDALDKIREIREELVRINQLIASTVTLRKK